jgi:hypothetical protein
MIISSIAKTLATICTYPVLTVRVNLQQITDKTQNVFKTILSIVKRVGLEGLYRGFFAKLF